MPWRECSTMSLRQEFLVWLRMRESISVSCAGGSESAGRPVTSGGSGIEKRDSPDWRIVPAGHSARHFATHQIAQVDLHRPRTTYH